MIIKLSGYPGGYRILSLAKDEATRKKLFNDNISTLTYNNAYGIILPENLRFPITNNEQEALEQCCNYDVFEIDENGNAYRYYNNNSVDNAILVTNRCNSNCLMCPTAESVRRKKDDYNADTLITLASHFPKDAPHITITGGEPFLIKKELFRVLAFLKNNLPETSYLLLTNGRAFCSKKFAELFYETAPYDTILGIPLHGYNAETHDGITQSKGSFDQTCLGLKYLLNLGSKVELRIVVSALNVNFITKIAQLIVTEFPNVLCVKFIGLEMTGNAAKNKDSVWIEYPIAFTASKKAIDILISNRIDVGIYNFPLCAVDRKYWNICEKSISDYKVRFAPMCDVCAVKDACGGIFSGTIRLAKENVVPVTGDYL